jgi:hypothetical protein
MQIAKSNTLQKNYALLYHVVELARILVKPFHCPPPTAYTDQKISSTS